MTDRDRLIELFEAVEKDPAITCPHYKTDKTCDTCKYTINNYLCNHTERMVDYLLANGVIVPPCKVGDKYVMDTAKTIFNAWNEVTGAVVKGTSWYYELESVIEDIVKLSFGAGVLYREEAEEKLKELGKDV